MNNIKKYAKAIVAAFQGIFKVAYCVVLLLLAITIIHHTFVLNKVQNEFKRLENFISGNDTSGKNGVTLVGEATRACRDALYAGRFKNYDMLDIELRLDRLKNQALLKDAKDYVDRLERYLDDQTINFADGQKRMMDADQAIAIAKEEGNAVSDLEARMPGLKKAVWLIDAEKAIKNLEAKMSQDPCYKGNVLLFIDNAEFYVRMAKKFGNDVSVLEAQMSELKKRV